MADLHTPLGSIASDDMMDHKQPQAEIEGMDQVKEYDPREDEGLSEAEKQMKDEEISFYSNSETENGDDNIWGLLSGAGGNIYEW